MEERIRNLEGLVSDLQKVCMLQQGVIDYLQRSVDRLINMEDSQAEINQYLITYCKALRKGIEELEGST
jgi:hypothetical protein